MKRGGTMAGPLRVNMTGMAYDSGKQFSYDFFNPSPDVLDLKKQTCGIILNPELFSFILLSILSMMSKIIGHLCTGRCLISYNDKRMKYLILKARKIPTNKTLHILPRFALIFIIVLAHDSLHIHKSKFSDLQNCQNIDFFEIESLHIINNIKCNFLTEKMTIFALDRLKFRNHSSFFKYLLLLSGDINLNPGPTNNPCKICSKSVSKRGLCCNKCGLKMHKKCTKTNPEIYMVQNDSQVSCNLCFEKTEKDPWVTWNQLPFPEESDFEIDEEAVESETDISNLSYTENWNTQLI